MKATVTAVAKLGYEVVEFYSPYLNWTTEAAKDNRKLLDDLGIKCLSTHNSAQAVSADNIAKTIEPNQIIGSKAIIVASAGKIVDVDGWKAFAATLTAAQEKLRPLGMATGFHNHQIEWKPLEGGERPMDILASGTRRRTSCCSSTAGLPAIEAGVGSRRLDQGQPRPHQEHPPQGLGQGKDRGYTVAFGEGDVQWKPLLAAAEATGGVELPHRAGKRRPKRHRDGQEVSRELQEAQSLIDRLRLCLEAFLNRHRLSIPRLLHHRQRRLKTETRPFFSGRAGRYAADRLRTDPVLIADLLQGAERTP